MFCNYWGDWFYMLVAWLGDMFMVKNKKKTFKKNEEYFDWFDKTKDKIEILELKIVDGKIKLEYQERGDENE